MTDGIAKKIGLVAVSLACAGSILVGMTGCAGNDPEKAPTVISESEAMESEVRATGSLQKIDNTDLAYDRDTKIVYYYFSQSGGYAGFGYLAPYYGPNGNLCRYENGQVVEFEVQSVDNASESNGDTASEDTATKAEAGTSV